MPALKVFLLVSTIAGLLASNVGCRTALQPDPDVAALLQEITYDTSVPPMRASMDLPETQVSTPAAPDAAARKSHTFRETIGDGLKAIGAFVLYGTMRVVESTLGFDDDDDDSLGSTPRSREDRELNEWLEDRERWRRGD